jgi:hypothetical protein
MMQVQKHHVRDEAGGKPDSRFQYSFKSRRHLLGLSRGQFILRVSFDL